MNEILAAWAWNGSVSEPIPYGEGHINQTYALTVTSSRAQKRYILQKINTDTFKDPAGLDGKYLRRNGFSARKG
ncbi:MAG: hypothetical protein V8S16_08360 [Gemmiger sp.]|uniref:hypothetical protein n=1 Tax=Gemmiger sp. TaxID=2049027 RepID=UPI00300F216D